MEFFRVDEHSAVFSRGDEVVGAPSGSQHEHPLFDVSDVILLGEFVSGEGPVLDDHFWVFVTAAGNRAVEISSQCTGVKQILQRVSDQLDGGQIEKVDAPLMFEGGPEAVVLLPHDVS